LRFLKPQAASPLPIKKNCCPQRADPHRIENKMFGWEGPQCRPKKFRKGGLLVKTTRRESLLSIRRESGGGRIVVSFPVVSKNKQAQSFRWLVLKPQMDGFFWETTNNSVKKEHNRKRNTVMIKPESVNATGTDETNTHGYQKGGKDDN